MLERVIAMGAVLTLLATAAAVVNADEATPPPAIAPPSPAKAEAPADDPWEPERKEPRKRGEWKEERSHRPDKDEDDDEERAEHKKRGRSKRGHG